MDVKNQFKKIIPVRALKSISMLTSGKFVINTTGFLYGVFAARLLGASGYGRLAVVMATVYLISLPFDFNFGSPLVKLIGERVHGKGQVRLRTIVQSALILQFLGAFIFGIIFLFFLLVFSENYQLLSDWSTALGLFGLSEVLHRPRKLFTSVLMGLQAYKTYTVSVIFVSVCRDIIPVIFMFTHGIVGACFGYLLAEIINLFFFAGLFSWIYSSKIIKSFLSMPCHFKKMTLKLFHNTRSNYLASICKRGFTESLSLILGGVIGTAGVGFYKVGLKFQPIFVFLVSPVSTYLYPRFVEKWSRQDKSEFFYTLRKYFYLMGVSGVCFVIILSAAAPWLVPTIFGAEFLLSVPVVWIVLPAALATQLFSIFASIAFTVSEQRTILNVAIIELLVGIPLAFLLVYNFGYLGAAWAFAIKVYVTAFYKARFFHKKFGWKWILPV